MVNLQNIDSNFNPYFSGIINNDRDLYAYIDESGDEGFDFSKPGPTLWFNVSAILLKPSTSQNMIKYVDDYRLNNYPKKILQNMDSKNLKHNQKKDIFIGLSKFKFITMHSLFYKPEIDPKNSLLTYPSMYFVGVKNVLERITWATSQFGFDKTHIIISYRNNIKKIDMAQYLFKNSIIAKKNLMYINKLGNVKFGNSNQKPQLLLSDYVSYTLRAAVEKLGNPPASEPYYFEWLQKEKLYSSNHKTRSGVWRNGIKCTPDIPSLLQHRGILDEGSHKL
jgi:hypothetical protein